MLGSQQVPAGRALARQFVVRRQGELVISAAENFARDLRADRTQNWHRSKKWVDRCCKWHPGLWPRGCVGSFWHTENQHQFHTAKTDRSPRPPGRTHKTTMPEPKSATVVDLQKVWDAQPSRYPDGTLVPPWMLYDPPTPYMIHPCQVIAFPSKGSPTSERS
jgi:hypothetical protein